MEDQSDSSAIREAMLAAAEALILERSFAGVSISDVAGACNIKESTIRAEFDNMSELAQAVLRRYAENDIALFERLSAQAKAETDDPLEHVILFISYFNEFLDDLARPFPGCIFASYVYSRRHFGPETHDYIARSLDGWCGLYERKFEVLLRARKPKVPVTSRALAEMITTTIEGGFVMGNAKKDASWTQRQSEQFQNYLRVLFEE